MNIHSAVNKVLYVCRWQNILTDCGILVGILQGCQYSCRRRLRDEQPRKHYYLSKFILHADICSKYYLIFIKHLGNSCSTGLGHKRVKLSSHHFKFQTAVPSRKNTDLNRTSLVTIPAVCNFIFQKTT